jgi:hypothetical protein
MESVEVKALSERMRFGSPVTWAITDGAMAPFLCRRDSKDMRPNIADKIGRDWLPFTQTPDQSPEYLATARRAWDEILNAIGQIWSTP